MGHQKKRTIIARRTAILTSIPARQATVCLHQLALRRIAARVRQGGHDVPRNDVVRRFKRGWDNFESVYRPLADSWAVYENSDRTPRLFREGGGFLSFLTPERSASNRSRRASALTHVDERGALC